MNKTNIEYIDYSWNPLAMRCTPVSEGCENCWHIKTANRVGANYKIPHDIRLSYHGNAPPVIVEARLNDPLKAKKPSVIGVQFMGDLFHGNVRFESIFSIWGIMAKAHWHTFLILTKRPAIMKDRLGWIRHFGRLPNVYLGVTAENQQRADERIPILLQIPAAKHFVSIEPMLNGLDVSPYLDPYRECDSHTKNAILNDLINEYQADSLRRPILDWVIVGGESGPGARPMYPDWARSVRDQCQEAGVPFFFKRHGDYNAKAQGLQFVSDPSNAGRLLDGREWNEVPE